MILHFVINIFPRLRWNTNRLRIIIKDTEINFSFGLKTERCLNVVTFNFYLLLCMRILWNKREYTVTNWGHIELGQCYVYSWKESSSSGGRYRPLLQRKTGLGPYHQKKHVMSINYFRHVNSFYSCFFTSPHLKDRTSVNKKQLSVIVQKQQTNKQNFFFFFLYSVKI